MCVIVLAAFASLYTRSLDFITAIRPILYGDELTARAVFALAAPTAIVWALILALVGVYRVQLGEGFFVIVRKVFFGTLAGLSAVLAYFFFTREFFNSRFLLIAFWIFATVFVLLAHAAIRAWHRHRLVRGKGAKRALLVAQPETAGRLRIFFKHFPEVGIRIGGSAPLDMLYTDETMPWQAFDVLLIGDVPEAGDLPKLTDLANAHQLELVYAADALNTRAENMYIRTYDSIPFIHFKPTPLEGWGAVAKRMCDITLAIVLLPAFALLYVVLAILIKIDSPGPVLVALPRIGQRGRVFKLYKFRSMVEGADKMKDRLQHANERKDGPLFKMSNDPRVTKIGARLRSSSVDELAQLINVLKGDMSFVGPRPHEPAEVARYTASQKKALTVRPGISGLAQISGRSGLSFADENRLDIYYIESWSLAIDLRVVCTTPWILIRRKHAV